jgi:hypothetical protein
MTKSHKFAALRSGQALCQTSANRRNIGFNLLPRHTDCTPETCSRCAEAAWVEGVFT